MQRRVHHTSILLITGPKGLHARSCAFVAIPLLHAPPSLACWQLQCSVPCISMLQMPLLSQAVREPDAFEQSSLAQVKTCAR